jgi:VanZ family protein
MILAVASVPLSTGPSSWTGSDKVAHGLEYGILGYLLRRALAPGGGRSYAVAIGVAVTVGIVDEVYQSFVPGRTPSPYDWLADLAGAAVGALVQPLLGSRRGRSARKGEITDE